MHEVIITIGRQKQVFSMRLSVICNECGRTIKVQSFAQDRVELSRLMGEEINLKCKKCGNIKKYHVNKITASMSNLLSMLLFILVFLFTFIIGFYLIKQYWGRSVYLVIVIPLAMSLPSFLYFTFTKSVNKSVRLFNRYRI